MRGNLTKGEYAVILTLSCMLLSTLILAIVEEANSQMMPPELQGTSQIGGKYVNPEFGLELVFPEDVFVTVIPQYSGPGSTLVSGQLPTQPMTSNMMVLMSDSSKVGSNNITLALVNSTAKDTCKPLSSELVTLDGKKAEASVTPCNMQAGTFSKTRNYYVDLGGGKTVSMVLNSPPSVYDSALEKFEGVVKTVKFTTPSTG